MSLVEKTYPMNNHVFKIDIENTRTRNMFKSYHKDTRMFFP